MYFRLQNGDEHQRTSKSGKNVLPEEYSGADATLEETIELRDL